MITRQQSTSGSGQQNPVALNNDPDYESREDNNSPPLASTQRRSISLSPQRQGTRSRRTVPAQEQSHQPIRANYFQNGAPVPCIQPTTTRRPQDGASTSRQGTAEPREGAHDRNYRHPSLLPEEWRTIIRALRAPQPTLPTFTGSDHEDPHNFLQECEEHFAQTATEPSQWTRIAGKALIESAAKWFELYKTISLPWAKFKEVLIKKYSGTTTLMRLQTTLYSKKQSEKENTAIFLQQKYMLALRLRPEAPEEEIVAILLESLRPSIRRAIRASAPTSFTELFDRAVEAEADEVDDVPKKEVRKEEVKIKPTPEPVNYTAPTRRMPPCNYCPERHFHRDCPVFNSRINQENWRASAQQNSNQGNWQGAAAKEAAAGLSTSNNQQ